MPRTQRPPILPTNYRLASPVVLRIIISVTAFGGITAKQYGVINRSAFPAFNVTELQVLTEVCPLFHDVPHLKTQQAKVVIVPLVTNTSFDRKAFHSIIWSSCTLKQVPIFYSYYLALKFFVHLVP